MATLLVAAALAAPSFAGAAPALPSRNVEWIAAAGDADVDRAFARARAERKPLLLYWGARWCPPCNRLQATLFNREDFAQQARQFVAVHVDGDRPGAQRLGTRFKVAGYPTLVLLRADGSELTRLPGDVDAEQVLALLQLGMAGGRPVRAVLDDARAGRAVTAGEWRRLAFYSWETDHEQLVGAAERPALLAELAAACPPAERETADRLWLKALAASDEGRGVRADAALRQRVLRLLADPAAVRAHLGVLAGGGDDIVRTLSADDEAARAPLRAAFDAALARQQADGSLARIDRLAALGGRIAIARLGLPRATLDPKLPPALLAEVREAAARADREVGDGHERQAVITWTASMLGDAGLWDDSDALLKANLSKSHSPYYLMSQLGANARQRGRHAEALGWYAQAFDTSVGPATRLQWGAGYLGALIELAPHDALRIERVASQLIAEAGQDSGAFDERSAHSLQRAGRRLASWSSDGRHAAALRRLQAQLDAVCAGLPAAEHERRTRCQRLLQSAAVKPA